MNFSFVPWRPSAESLSPARLFSVSPFAPTARRNEAESERLSSVRDALHPEGGEEEDSELRDENGGGGVCDTLSLVLFRCL